MPDPGARAGVQPDEGVPAARPGRGRVEGGPSLLRDVRPPARGRDHQPLAGEQPVRPPGGGGRDAEFLLQLPFSGKPAARRELAAFDAAAQPRRDLPVRGERRLIVDLELGHAR